MPVRLCPRVYAEARPASSFSLEGSREGDFTTSFLPRASNEGSPICACGFALLSSGPGQKSSDADLGRRGHDEHWFLRGPRHVLGDRTADRASDTAPSVGGRHHNVGVDPPNDLEDRLAG